MTLQTFLIKAVEARRVRELRQIATIPSDIYNAKGGWRDHYFYQNQSLLRWMRREYMR